MTSLQLTESPIGADVARVFRSVDGQRGLPSWFALVFNAIAKIDYGALEWRLPDGRVFRAEGTLPGPQGRVIVHDGRLFARILRHGNLGFCEAYMDGWWSAAPDLQDVMDVILLNNEAVARRMPGGMAMRLANRFRHWLNSNSRSGAKRNIEAHYDLSNAFYQLWLDRSMTYSSALFESEGDGSQSAPQGASQGAGQDAAAIAPLDGPTLEAGQEAKYRSICDRMGLQPGDHVLEIGCGWGGFAEYAAGVRGARVTGLTLSPAQLEFAQARMARRGLGDRVELRLRDYRDETGLYDGVASIEMFEAVGERYWPSYFSAVRDRLKPGGRASLQIITIDDRLFDTYRRRVDFIQKYVFPGGMLPSMTALREQTDAAGLIWDGAVEFGPSYSRTLRAWRVSFGEAWNEVAALSGARPFDARFKRLWDLYLASCAACFRAGTTNVAQIALKRA
ncbi:MAG: cyclopropane-fatty-acyl-phospholipid synthase family protein [Pseudomonadota bacterium]